MRRPFLLSCLLLAFLFCGPSARAQDGMRWMCWLGSEDDYNIHCLREVDPVLDEAAELPQELFDDVRMQSASQPPSKSSDVAREAIRRHRDIVWSIPLYSMPFDAKDVELLAQVMMCGTDARCEVIFTRQARQVASH